jgi:hypothetical protein
LAVFHEKVSCDPFAVQNHPLGNSKTGRTLTRRGASRAKYLLDSQQYDVKEVFALFGGRAAHLRRRSERFNNQQI